MPDVTEAHLRDELLNRRQRLAAAVGWESQGDLTALIDEVDAALERLDGEAFGTCESCREPIEGDRLLADPLTRVCLGCLSPEETRALEHDLATAADIQAALLPEPAVDLAGWEARFHYQPLGPVSGDYCDLVEPRTPGHALHFLFGDVSGKGVSASLLMAHLQALLRPLISPDRPLEEILAQANRLLCQSTLPSSYATLVVGRAHPAGGLEICNAGHCPPLIARNGELIRVPASGCPLGLFPITSLTTQRVHLGPGELLFLYSDGLSEAEDESGEQYGWRRIRSVVEDSRGLPAAATIEGCLENLKAFRNGTPATDDLTLMVVRRAVEAAPA